MSDVLDWIITIVLFIISLSLLITIHELGHFSMAKLFKVYCHEFSIGFGPALLKKRKEGKETAFAIRALPLGGFVAMAGEDTDISGVNIPPERTIDGVKRWKKAIILAAGITLNAVLALVLFGVSNIAMPLTQLTTRVHIQETSDLYSQGLRDEDRMYLYGTNDSKAVVFNNETIDGNAYNGVFYIVNDDVEIKGNKYVACFAPSGNKSEPTLTGALHFYPADTDNKIANAKTFKEWADEGVTLVNYPDITKGLYNIIEEVSADVSLKFYKYSAEGYDPTPVTYVAHMSSVKTGDSSYEWNDLGVSFKTIDTWLPFGERVKNTFEDFGSGSIAVFQGLISLVTQGPKNVSGVIGILTTSSTVLKNYRFSTYIRMWALISVNLAIFNLLPFPGLDGWQLLVTAIEGGTNSIKKRKYVAVNGTSEGYVQWKIPTKVKTIVSFVGLGLLFLLMLVIGVYDIIRIV